MDLNKIYKKWIIIQSIFHKLQLDYEFKNILERFLLSGDISKFNDEVKIFGNANEIKETVNFLMSTYEKAPTPDFEVKAELGDNYFKCGRYHRYLSPDRVNIFRKFDLNEVAMMVMRYATILSTSQHWSVPSYVYRKVIMEHKIEIEGFASPINSQFLKMHHPFKYIDKNQKMHESKAVVKKPAYCSIFKEDAPFYSLGSFFECDFRGKRVLANPPFVLSLMNEMAKKILTDVKAKNTVFIVNVPNWTDAEYYENLKNSPYCRQYIEFAAFKHWYEENDNYVLASFPISYFVISNENEGINLENIYDF